MSTPNQLASLATDPGQTSLPAPAAAPQAAQTSLAPPTQGTTDLSGLTGGTQVPATPAAPTGPKRVLHTLADGIMSAFKQTDGKPGDWAKAVNAGAVSALAGVGNIGAVPKGAGALYGIGKVAEAQQKRSDAQRAQAADAAYKAKQLDLEQQRVTNEQTLQKAQIGEANARAMMNERIARNSDIADQDTRMKSDQDAATAFKNENAPVLGQGLTSDAVQQMIKDKKLDPTQAHKFIDGYVDALDAKGNPILDSTGAPKRRATYSLLGPVPSITLDQTQADYLNKFVPQSTPYSAGTVVPGETYYNQHQLAQTHEAVQLNVDKLAASLEHEKAGTEHEKAGTAAEKAKLAETTLSIHEKQRNDRTDIAFAPYLAQASGDPIVAMQMVHNDPKLKEDARNKLMGDVEFRYGPGNLMKAKNETVQGLTKTIEDKQKQVSRNNTALQNYQTSDEEKADLTSENADLRAEIGVASVMVDKYQSTYNAPPSPDKLGMKPGTPVPDPVFKRYLTEAGGDPLVADASAQKAGWGKHAATAQDNVGVTVGPPKVGTSVEDEARATAQTGFEANRADREETKRKDDLSMVNSYQSRLENLKREPSPAEARTLETLQVHDKDWDITQKANYIRSVLGISSSTGVVSVMDPNGVEHKFPNQAAADTFKKKANIQ